VIGEDLFVTTKVWIVPIFGTTKLHRLDENIGAAKIDLSIKDINEINEALATIEVKGHRYNDQAQKMINR